MRNEKAIENIRSVMEQQELEWLKENGYDPVVHKPEKRNFFPKRSEAKFAASRFLGEAMPEEPKPEEPEELEPESLPESEESPEPEIVNVLPQKDSRHSWLYNEVVKAIRDASAGTKTKVVAVFIPVIQNAEEFKNIPADVSIELPAVNEEDFADDADIVGDLLPEPIHEPDPELASAFKTMEENWDSSLPSDAEETEAESSETPEPEEPEAEAAESEPMPEPELETLEPEPETVPEPEAPEPEIAEIQELDSPEPELTEDLESEEDKGEPLAFTEIEMPDDAEEIFLSEDDGSEPQELTEIELPAELDDDEIEIEDEAQTEQEKH